MAAGPGNWVDPSCLHAGDRVYSGEGTLWTKLWAKTWRGRCPLGQKAANHATVGTLVRNLGTDAARAKVCGMSPNTQWRDHDMCLLRMGDGRQKRDASCQYLCTHSPYARTFTSTEAYVKSTFHTQSASHRHWKGNTAYNIKILIKIFVTI